MGARMSITSISVARAISGAVAVAHQRRHHRAVDRADQRGQQVDAHPAARTGDDLDDRVDPLAQQPALELAERGLAGTGDVALVAEISCSLKGSLAGSPTRRSTSTSAVASGPAPPRQLLHPGPQLRGLHHPDVRDGVDDEIVQRREVVGGRGQRQPGALGDGAVAHRFESTLAQQVGGGADKRIPSPFSLGRNRCGHGSNAASHPDGAPPFHRIINFSQNSRFGRIRPRWQDGRMPNLSRRAVLRLGAPPRARQGAVAAGPLFGSTPTVTGPAVAMTGVGAPLLPPPPLDPATAGVAAPPWSPVRSSPRRAAGIPTNWAVARPPGQTRPLRPVIALHGKGSDAATVMAGGVEQGLAEAVQAGLPPFAVVAVDGGGSYFHRRASGGTPGRWSSTN